MPFLLHPGSSFGGWDKKKYKIVEILNKGSYGTVYLARQTRTLKLYAIKQIINAQKDIINHELSVLTRLRKSNSPNIIKLVDSFSDKSGHYIVLEYCSLGDLYEVISADRVPRDTETIRDLVLQLISAVEACHKVGVYHRDIKPENIFLSLGEDKKKAGDGDVVVKLGDFGLATMETWSDDIGTGSDRYMAPEQFEADSSGGYSPQFCDIWSLGIVIVNTLFSRNPWKVPNLQDPIFTDFVRDSQSIFDHFPDMSADTFSVLRHSLSLDPNGRSLSAMREAVLNVTEWTNTHYSVNTNNSFSRRNSTLNFADYHDNGPTAGRTPLRTPSIAQQISPLKSFPWATVLADEPSWNSIDSGLGKSIEFSPPKTTLKAKPRPVIACSAPQLKVPSLPKEKKHLQFSTSWADADDDFDDDFEEPPWADDENVGSDEPLGLFGEKLAL